MNLTVASPPELQGYSHHEAPTQFVDTSRGRLAYRRFGASDGVPLVFLQHFTGTMDYWDPAVTNGFASERPVVLFDNVGVGASSGVTPRSVRAMADDAAAFIEALGHQQVDLLGFSLGGFVAQSLASAFPALVRRAILAGTGPSGGEGIADLGNVLAAGNRVSPVEPRLYLFFTQTENGQHSGRAFIERQSRRTTDRASASGGAVAAQFAAIIDWGQSTLRASGGSLNVTQPVLVVNGKTDVMVPTPNSYALFQQVPNARLVLYPDSGHGALFQHGDAFVAEGLRFLSAT
jgi:pimeloyl-ACP methyl ester carboxylesterase